MKPIVTRLNNEFLSRRTTGGIWSLALALTLLFFPAASFAREGSPLDEGWKFFQSDAPGAEQTGFDDSKWNTVNLPHDWSIAGPFAATNKTGGAGAFLPSGVAWYRQNFVWENPAWFTNHVLLVEFDGVMQNSDVWFNGHRVGGRPNGYIGFSSDLTPWLAPGKTNILAVRCDTSAQPASRWYSGAGIYRHVRLCPLPRVRFDEASPFVSTPFVSTTSAVVRAQSTITNESSQPAQLAVEFFIWPPGGNPICRTSTPPQIVAPGASLTVTQEVTVAAPKLWDTEHPVLYQGVARILFGKEIHQVQTVSFGIREAKFTADSGFVLNGRKVLLKGACVHHDGGAFGVAVPLSIWEDRLKTLRALGVNAVRTAHQTPAPDFLDLCDRMGIFVMDEFFDCWTVGKTPFDYHLYFKDWSARDAADTVRRDRNHPSVILWNIGNEIHDTPKPKIAIPIAHSLVEVCHANDPTRPVTQALFRPNISGDYTNGLADSLDVIGTNYRDNELLAAQRAKPGRKIINTEQRHDRQQWLWLRDTPSLAGQFLWVGVDYLGESRKWPRVGYAGGLLDRTGAVKPMAFERQSWWSDAPMVRICRRVAPDDKMPGDPGMGGAEMFTPVQFADWTPRNPAPHDETIEAYSNCEEVELFLNDQSLGAKKLNPEAAPRVWKIPFVPGTLKAVAKNSSKVVTSDELRTAGKAARIELKTQNQQLKTSWDDVAIVRATIVDADGIPVPRADDLISFQVSGPGVIAAVDNGDNDSHEPFQATARRAYQGTCAAFVKFSSQVVYHHQQHPINVTATAAGLKSGSINLLSAE